MTKRDAIERANMHLSDARNVFLEYGRDPEFFELSQYTESVMKCADLLDAELKAQGEAIVTPKQPHIGIHKGE